MRVITITARESEAYTIATQIAEVSDWTFDGIDGWKNLDPDLPSKVQAIRARYPAGTFGVRAKAGTAEDARKVIRANLGVAA